MKWLLVVCPVFFSGCGAMERFLPLSVAKQSSITALEHRMDRVEDGLDKTTNVAKGLVAGMKESQERLSAVESGIQSIDKQLLRKIDVSQFESKLNAWAGGSDGVVRRSDLGAFATQTQGQIGALGQQLAGKMDNFQIQSPMPSTVVQGAVCMFFRDRNTNQWWCWRWMQSNPAPTTRLLFHDPQTCQWVEMPQETGWNIARERQLPMPPHVFQQQAPGSNDQSSPVPMPPAPTPQQVGVKSRRSVA